MSWLAAPTAERESYLIWSHQHAAWWRPHRRGYTRHIGEAGLYERRAALDLCARSVPDTAEALGALPDLPVRHADLEAVRRRDAA